AARLLGEHERAQAHLEEGLALHRRLGQTRSIATALANLGHLAMAREDFAAAQSLYEESFQLFRDLDHLPGLGNGLLYLAAAATARGELETARALLAEALHLDEARAPGRFLPGLLAGFAALEGAASARHREGDGGRQ